MIWSLKPLQDVKVFLLIFFLFQFSSWKRTKFDVRVNWGKSFSRFLHIIAHFLENFIYLFIYNLF